MDRQLSSLLKVNLNINQKAAIQSFVDDRGIEIFKNSRLLKVINSNNFELVPDEFRKWVVANGKLLPELVILREQEINLFISGS